MGEDVRVLVVGAGAIGILVGARLTLGGHQVTFVVRPSLEERLRRDGVRLTDGESEHILRNVGLAASVAAAATTTYDWIAVTVKAYDVPGAAREIGESWRKPPPVATFQNGIGSEETAAATLASERIVPVSVTIPVSVPGPGQVEARKRGGLGVAPFALAHVTDARRVYEALHSAGFTTAWYDDYQAMKWSKLLTNMMGNATSAILDMAPEAVYANPRLFRVELAALREAVAVMNAWGFKAVNLPGLPVSILAWAASTLPAAVLRPILQRLIAGGRGGKMPSLNIDMTGGKGRSEIVYLNGAVHAWGARKGIAAPVNRILTETLEGLIQGHLAWDDYRRQPEALLRLVARPVA